MDKSKEIINDALNEHKIQKTTRKDVEFYPTGITLLDLCLGGGFGKGYISNVVGWEAVGKTILVCEALGCNHNKNKDFKHTFDNSESGFTLDTKELFNFNINLIEPRSEKVEQFMYNFERTLSKLKEDQDMIYVLDSLDGLSDEREERKHKEDMKKIKKAIEEDKESNIKGDYSGKAKGISQFLRQNNAKINKTNMHLCITSQLRTKIGVMFGNPAERSGGKALNFYASQIIWLKKIRTLLRKVKVNDVNYERETGILIKAEVKKNKLGKSFRDCFLFIDFDLGIDNVKSNIYFLYDLITKSGELREKKEYIWNEEKFTSIDEFIAYIEENNLEKELEKKVIDLWNEVEESLIVKRKRKY